MCRTFGESFQYARRSNSFLEGILTFCILGNAFLYLTLWVDVRHFVAVVSFFLRYSALRFITFQRQEGQVLRLCCQFEPHFEECTVSQQCLVCAGFKWMANISMLFPAVKEIFPGQMYCISNKKAGLRLDFMPGQNICSAYLLISVSLSVSCMQDWPLPGSW